MTGPRLAPLVTLVAGLVCALVAASSGGGGRGAVSALLGTGVVVLFFWSGLVPLLLVRGQEDRAALGLGVLLVNYTLRLALALLLLRAADSAGAVDTEVLGITIIITTLVWTGAHVALLSRSRPTL